MVATRSVLLLLCNSLSFSVLNFIVVVSAANVVLFFFLVLVKMAVFDVSQKYDVIIRIFEHLKYQNIPALTVWPIVPITFLILNNHQSGRLTAKKFEVCIDCIFHILVECHILPGQSRQCPHCRKIGTVSSNRIYKMHVITFIHVTSTHCRIQIASYYITIAFKFFH